MVPPSKLSSSLAVNVCYRKNNGREQWGTPQMHQPSLKVNLQNPCWMREKKKRLSKSVKVLWLMGIQMEPDDVCEWAYHQHKTTSSNTSMRTILTRLEGKPPSAEA